MWFSVNWQQAQVLYQYIPEKTQSAMAGTHGFDECLLLSERGAKFACSSQLFSCSCAPEDMLVSADFFCIFFVLLLLHSNAIFPQQLLPVFFFSLFKALSCSSPKLLLLQDCSPHEPCHSSFFSLLSRLWHL